MNYLFNQCEIQLYLKVSSAEQEKVQKTKGGAAKSVTTFVGGLQLDQRSHGGREQAQVCSGFSQADQHSGYGDKDKDCHHSALFQVLHH